MAEKATAHKRTDQEVSSGSGRPTMKAARKVYKKNQQAEDKHNMDYAQMTEGNDGRWSNAAERDNKFPVRLYPRDPMDTTVALKQQMGPEFGQRTLTQDEMDWAKRKLEASQLADKKQWVLSQFDMRDAAQRRQFQEMFPEVLSEQESIIDDRAELAARLAKMRLRGPQSKEDYDFLYLLNTKAIEAPTGDLWNPTGWNKADTTLKSRGLFNPMRYKESGKPQPWFSWDAMAANKNNTADPFGYSQQRAAGGGTAPAIDRMLRAGSGR